MEEQLFIIDDAVLGFMKTKQLMEIGLSSISIVYNILLIVFLLKTDEFHSWAFFPIMMQAFVDIIGPGIANIVFECQLTTRMREFIVQQTRTNSIPFLLPRDFVLFNSLSGIPQCLLVYLRVLLNEYTTGCCMVATAVFRYLSVYQPTWHIKQKLCPRVAIAIVSVVFVASLASVLQLLLADDPSYFTIR